MVVKNLELKTLWNQEFKWIQFKIRTREISEFIKVPISVLLSIQSYTVYVVVKN